MRALFVRAVAIVFLLGCLYFSTSVGLAEEETSETKVEIQTTYVMNLFHLDGSLVEGSHLTLEADDQQHDPVELTLNIHSITNFDVYVYLEDFKSSTDSLTPGSLMLSTTASGKSNTSPIIKTHFPGTLRKPLFLTSSLSGENNANGQGETINIRFEFDEEMIQDFKGTVTYTIGFEVIEL